MRLDKFFTQTGVLTRRECASAAKSGKITVDGVIVKKPDMHIDPEKNTVYYLGNEILYKKNIYIMLNKPDGYVSATDAPGDITVLELLPEKLRRQNLFPCGRLDKNTVGLMILTNNGAASHRLLAPKNHISKKYRFETFYDVTEDEISKLESGTVLADGYETKPCKIEMTGKNSGIITLTEGKYHQIKRMFGSTGNKITFLERISFSDIVLDETLERGQWRYLTEKEETVFDG